jgi:hypothetical protein
LNKRDASWRNANPVVRFERDFWRFLVQSTPSRVAPSAWK